MANLILHWVHAVASLAIVFFYLVASVTAYQAWVATYRATLKANGKGSGPVFVNPLSVYAQFLAPSGARGFLKWLGFKDDFSDRPVYALIHFSVLTSFSASVAMSLLAMSYAVQYALDPPYSWVYAFAKTWAHAINALALTGYNMALTRHMEQRINATP